METSEIRIVFFQNHLLFIFEQLYGNPTTDWFSQNCIGELTWTTRNRDSRKTVISWGTFLKKIKGSWMVRNGSHPQRLILISAERSVSHSPETCHTKRWQQKYCSVILFFIFLMFCIVLYTVFVCHLILLKEPQLKLAQKLSSLSILLVDLPMNPRQSFTSSF